MHYNDDDHFDYMNNMDNFIGFKSDIIPGEIVKEEISEIATTRIFSIQRIEYFTKNYKFDELRNALLNKTKYCECKIKNIDIENQDIEKKKLIMTFLFKMKILYFIHYLKKESIIMFWKINP